MAAAAGRRDVEREETPALLTENSSKTLRGGKDGRARKEKDPGFLHV